MVDSVRIMKTGIKSMKIAQKQQPQPDSVRV